MPWLKRILSSPLVRQMIVAALLFAAEVIKQDGRKKPGKK